MIFLTSFPLLQATRGDVIEIENRHAVHYLHQTNDRKDRVVVPRNVVVKKATLRLDAAPSIDIETYGEIPKSSNVLYEAWLRGGAWMTCYVARFGEAPLRDWPSEWGSGSIAKAERKRSELSLVGSAKVDGHRICFAMPGAQGASLYAVVVRWLPEDQFRESPFRLWTALAQILVEDESRSMDVPFLI